MQIKFSQSFFIRILNYENPRSYDMSKTKNKMRILFNLSL